MNEERQSHRTQIVIAIISLLGVLGGALFANWDKIFEKAVEPNKLVNSKYIVAITYFPKRTGDAERVVKVLDAQGFITSLTPAGKDIAHEEQTPSYIYFKDEKAQENAIRVRELISAVVTHKFNLFADPKMAEKQINVFLTHGN